MARRMPANTAPKDSVKRHAVSAASPAASISEATGTTSVTPAVREVTAFIEGESDGDSASSPPLTTDAKSSSPSSMESTRGRTRRPNLSEV